jgi:hypothetical protein
MTKSNAEWNAGLFDWYGKSEILFDEIRKDWNQERNEMMGVIKELTEEVEIQSDKKKEIFECLLQWKKGSDNADMEIMEKARGMRDEIIFVCRKNDKKRRFIW